MVEHRLSSIARSPTESDMSRMGLENGETAPIHRTPILSPRVISRKKAIVFCVRA